MKGPSQPAKLRSFATTTIGRQKRINSAHPSLVVAQKFGIANREEAGVWAAVSCSMSVVLRSVAGEAGAFGGLDDAAGVGEDREALAQGGGANAAAGAQLCYRAESTGTDGHGHDGR